MSDSDSDRREKKRVMNPAPKDTKTVNDSKFSLPFPKSPPPNHN